MKGLTFGLLYQTVCAIGFIWVAGVAQDANSVVKANFMLCVAGVISLFVLGGFAIVRGGFELQALPSSDLIKLAIGAVLILVVGESIYILGLSASNATTMAYTALAFPAICLVLDVTLQRIPLSSLTIRDYVGMALLAAGFSLLAARGTS